MTIGPNKCQAPFIFTWRLHNVVIKILVSRLAPLLSRASHCLARGWDSAGAGWRGEGIKGGTPGPHRREALQGSGCHRTPSWEAATKAAQAEISSGGPSLAGE